MKNFETFWRATNYCKLQPSNALTSSGRGPADPGREYVVYQNAAVPFTVEITGAAALRAPRVGSIRSPANSQPQAPSVTAPPFSLHPPHGAKGPSCCTCSLPLAHEKIAFPLFLGLRVTAPVTAVKEPNIIFVLIAASRSF